MIKFLKLYKFQILIVLGILAMYGTFAYDLERADFVKLITLYAGLTFLSYKLIQLMKVNFTTLVIIGVLFRFVFLFAMPNLSQDFYRFIWDGRMLISGGNPYLSTPAQWAVTGDYYFAQGQQLVDGMGALNASHFTNYPPINQLFFAMGAMIGWESISGTLIAYRILLIFADLGIVIIGRKLLEDLKLPEHRIFWYFLNPFVIIEFAGNIHFEGMMLFFLLSGIYMLYHGRWFYAALLIGVSISVKLIPLIFLPLLWKFLIKERKTNKLKPSKTSLFKLLGFYVTVALCVFLTFMPFLTGFLVNNFAQSVALWFQKFEFNASIFYIIREIGFSIKGYNVLTKVTPYLATITFLFVVGLSIFGKGVRLKPLIATMVFSIFFYFLLSTTVHPWYAATPLLLCLFTRYRFPLLWAGTVMLSYYAYGFEEVKENYWLLGLEYGSVVLFMLYEVFWLQPKEKEKAPKKISEAYLEYKKS